MTMLKKGAIPLLRLCKNDFDSRGDFDFPCPNGDVQQRGGIPYNQPGMGCQTMFIRIGTWILFLVY